MITDLLTRSVPRRRLLALLFANPGKRYYQRQMEKLLGQPVALIHRELRRLEREGLVDRERQGNLVLFGANEAHPLFPELSSIIAKTVGIPSALHEALARLRSIRLALLFGSYSRLQAREKGAAWTGESDVDLLVIGDTDLGELSGHLASVEAQFQRTVNPTLFRIREFACGVRKADPFLVDVFKHAVVPLVGFGDLPYFTSERLSLSAVMEKLHESKRDRRTAGA